MKVLAKLGTLPDGRCALAIQDAYSPNFVVVRNYDEETQTWSSGRYFDGSLTAFAQYIVEETHRLEEEMALEIPMTVDVDSWKRQQDQVKKISRKAMGSVILEEMLDTELDLSTSLGENLANFCDGASQEETKALSSFFLEISDGRLSYPPEFLTSSRAYPIEKELVDIFTDMYIQLYSYSLSSVEKFISYHADAVGETFYDLVMAVQTPSSIQSVKNMIEEICGSDLQYLIRKAEKLDQDMEQARVDSSQEEREFD